MHQLKGFIAEDLKSFLMPEQIDLIHDHYQHINGLSILEVDALSSKKTNQEPILVDQNEVFPIRILVAE